jgi:outer membrane biogenesis lipoprotein LolB
MLKNYFVAVLLLSLSLLLTGCATMGDVSQSKESGTNKVYAADKDKAWDIAKTVFRWEGSDAS